MTGILSHLESLFDPEAPRHGDSLLDQIVSDYLAYYGPPTPTRIKWSVWGSNKGGSPRRLALLFLPRLLNNPCLHATLLLRLAARSPRLIGFWRTILIAKHSIDIQRQLEIGPGLVLPHPFGIGFGTTVRIGSNVTILNGVMLGGNTGLGGGLRDPEPGAQLCPVIGDDVVLFARATLVGDITIGDRAVVGAGAWVDHDLAARAIQPGLAALYRKLDEK